jgi:hypothetical protein
MYCSPTVILLAVRRQHVHASDRLFAPFPSRPVIQFEFKIKGQKEAVCSKVLMEGGAGNDFQTYMRMLNFNQCRMGYLYGTVSDTNEVRMMVIMSMTTTTTTMMMMMMMMMTLKVG